MMTKTPIALAAALALTCSAAIAAETKADRSKPTNQSARAESSTKSDQQSRVDQATISKTIESWPDNPKKAAKKMIDTYGLPNEATASALVWSNNGPWKKTLIMKEEIKHDWPEAHTDYVEQFIDYRVPPEKFSDLAKYDGSVIAERTRGVISARCGGEDANFLALNLAHEIIQGKRSVEEARKFYAETMKAKNEGKSSPYMQKLLFKVAEGGTADADEPAMKAAAK